MSSFGLLAPNLMASFVFLVPKYLLHGYVLGQPVRLGCPARPARDLVRRPAACYIPL
jgi:hypothetical protein